jgi:hypothetical protein
MFRGSTTMNSEEAIEQVNFDIGLPDRWASFVFEKLALKIYNQQFDTTNIQQLWMRKLEQPGRYLVATIYRIADSGSFPRGADTTILLDYGRNRMVHRSRDNGMEERISNIERGSAVMSIAD